MQLDRRRRSNWWGQWVVFIALIVSPTGSGLALSQDLPADVLADIERKRTEADMRSAVVAFEAKDYEKALRFLDKLIANQNELPASADYMDAVSAGALGKWKRADLSFQRYFKRAKKSDSFYESALEFYLLVESNINTARQAETQLREKEDEQVRLSQKRSFEEQKARIREKLTIPMPGSLVSLNVDKNDRVQIVTYKFADNPEGSALPDFDIYLQSLDSLSGLSRPEIILRTYELPRVSNWSADGTADLLESLTQYNERGGFFRNEQTLYKLDTASKKTKKVGGSSPSLNGLPTEAVIRYNDAVRCGTSTFSVSTRSKRRSKQRVWLESFQFGGGKSKQIPIQTTMKGQLLCHLTSDSSGNFNAFVYPVEAPAQGIKKSFISSMSSDFRERWYLPLDEFEAKSVITLKDDTLLVLGSHPVEPKIALATLSASGEKIWTKYLSYFGYGITSVFPVELSSGRIGLLAFGESFTNSEIAVIDRDGKLLARKNFTGLVFSALAEYRNGFVAVGTPSETLASSTYSYSKILLLDSELELAPQGGWSTVGLDNAE